MEHCTNRSVSVRWINILINGYAASQNTVNEWICSSVYNCEWAHLSLQKIRWSWSEYVPVFKFCVEHSRVRANLKSRYPKKNIILLYLYILSETVGMENTFEIHLITVGKRMILINFWWIILNVCPTHCTIYKFYYKFGLDIVGLRFAHKFDSGMWLHSVCGHVYDDIKLNVMCSYSIMDDIYSSKWPTREHMEVKLQQQQNTFEDQIWYRL